ncbi:MAG: hypothetical protein JWO70_1245 [Betaproteobacteria bacterium]|jgi:hypothetical protein|nr:hypothetical protein [Betaproteobacteria bacterium]
MRLTHVDAVQAFEMRVWNIGRSHEFSPEHELKSAVRGFARDQA